MAKTDAEILDIYFSRSNAHSGSKGRQRSVRDHYNGDIVVPLPEIDAVEQSSVANLLAQGLDQTAMRISSTFPDMVFPATDETSDRSVKYARKARRAVFGWHQASRSPIQLGRRARHLIGYSENVAQVRWDKKMSFPKFVTRDPLTTYPANTRGPEDMTPANVVFGYERSLAWMKKWYPESALRFAGATRDGVVDMDRPLTMVEYCDDEETVLIGLMDQDWMVSGSSEPVVERLDRAENRIGMCPVTVGERLSLDEARGQFDGMLGMYQQQAKLMALEVIAVQKGIFPDTWLVGNAGEQPKIITPADGLAGDIGIVRGGKLQDTQLQPGFMTNPAIDRLERGQRLEARVPAEFGGESGSNIRTGRRGNAVLAAVVDFTVQEAQLVLSEQMAEENKIAIATAKAHGGNRPVSFYVKDTRAKGKVDYTPNKHFLTDNNIVEFPQVGSDANDLVVGGGQRVQMGTLSKRDFMEIDPFVKDAERTSDRIVVEGLEEALQAGIAQQAATGQIPPKDLAKIMIAVEHDKASLAKAVADLAEEQEEAAAAAGPVAGPPGEPSPEMSMAGAPPGQPSMQDLLGALGGASA